MTAAEYIQLKAFARIDGALLALVWTASFTLYVAGTASPLLMMAGLMLAVASPFFAAGRLRLFRDKARGGFISFRRGYAYVAFMFFYAALLFALAQFAYFQYMDNGYLASQVSNVLGDAETKALLQQSGLWHDVENALVSLSTIRPIDFALNYLYMNIMAGLVLGLPIAAYAKKATTQQ